MRDATVPYRRVLPRDSIIIMYQHAREGHETRSSDKIGSTPGYRLSSQEPDVWRGRCGDGVKYTSRTWTNRVDKEYPLL